MTLQAASHPRIRTMRGIAVNSSLAVALAALLGVACAPAFAQAHVSGYRLPLALANEAVMETVRVCEESGFNVSASVVDTSGELIAFAKGDHSTAHTREGSFRKAYTVITFAPSFGFDRLSAFTEKFGATPAGAAFATLPDVMMLPGAVAIRYKDEVVAAIGAAGAPGGSKDEVCAAAGLEKIMSRLAH